MNIEQMNEALILSDVIAGQNKALEQALQGAPLSVTLSTLIRTVEAQAGVGFYGSILMVDQDGKTLSTVAGPSLPLEYNEALHNIPIGPNFGSCGSAAFHRDIVSVNDIANDPLWTGFNELALKHNLRACWSTPILSSRGSVLGTFAIYRNEVGNPRPRDYEIVKLITRTAALLMEKQMATVSQNLTESHLELALNASRTGFWYYDLNTAIVKVSDVLREDWGLDPYENAHHIESIFKCIHPDDRENVSGALLAAQKSERPYDLVFRIKKAPTNEIRYIWAKGQVLVDTHNVPYQMIGTSIDITEQKRAEKELRDLEKQLIAYAEAMPQIAFMADPEGKIVYHNQQLKDFLGFKENELEGWGWKEKAIFHPEDMERTSRAWAESLKTGQPYQNEYRMRRHDGEYIWFLGRAVPYRDEDGNIVRWYGTKTDIHAHKMQFHKNEKFLEAVLQTIEAGVVACDGDGKLSLFNRATTEFHGIPFMELPSSEWAKHYDLFLADGKTPMQMKDVPLFRALNGERIKNVEMVISPKNGAPRHVSASGSLLVDSDGDKLGAVVAMHDITELKRAETVLKDYNVALQAANQELEAFAYSVSHDLRAPLRGIDGFSKALMDDYKDVIDETGQKYLGFVREGVQRMGQLIDDLLKLSRVSRVEMHRGDVSLSEIAFDVIARLRQMEPERSITVSIRKDLSVVGDRGLLTILMENLLSNAWKFTSKREKPEVEFGMMGSNEDAVFFVKDNGSGFDMAYQNKLFGAFQRLHTAKEFKGTGIGLATVRRVVHRHGGNVWAEAKLDQGATFFFKLGLSHPRSEATHDILQ